MTFQNEYVSKLENEKSEFLVAVRKQLRLGFVSTDQWTVDRKNKIVLIHTGFGHDIDSQDEEYWSFLVDSRQYRLHTKTLAKEKISNDVIRIERSLAFVVGDGLAGEPRGADLQELKAALTAHMDYGVISRYASCEMILKSVRGEEL